MHHQGAKLLDAVHVLAANLNRLVEIAKERKTGLGSNAAIGAKAGISSNTVGRMRRADGSVGIGNLSKVARVFGLQANQLLTPGVNPSDPPEIVAADDEKMLLKAFRARGGDQPPSPSAPRH